MQTIEIDGKTVEYDQTGQGPDLLLLHTLLADASVYDVILPRLAAQRRVTRLSFPGFGASQPGCETIDAFADWTVAAIRALELPSSTDVFANGFGGFVAGSLAIRNGGLVNRLVLADTGAGFPDAGKAPLRGMAQKVRADGIDAILDIAMSRMFPPAYAAAHPEVVEGRKTALRGVDREGFSMACLALADLDNRSLLHEIKNPVLVCVGLDDQTTPPAMARELADGIADAQYRELTGVGHCPQLQDPDQLLDVVGAFLALH